MFAPPAASGYSFRDVRDWTICLSSACENRRKTVRSRVFIPLRDDRVCSRSLSMRSDVVSAFRRWPRKYWCTTHPVLASRTAQSKTRLSRRSFRPAQPFSLSLVHVNRRATTSNTLPAMPPILVRPSAHSGDGNSGFARRAFADVRLNLGRPTTASANPRL